MSKVVIQGLSSRRLVTQGYATAEAPQTPLPPRLVSIGHPRRQLRAVHRAAVLHIENERRTVEVG